MPVEALARKEAVIGVMGLGYVGLPLLSGLGKVSSDADFAATGDSNRTG